MFSPQTKIIDTFLRFAQIFTLAKNGSGFKAWHSSNRSYTYLINTLPSHRWGAASSIS